MKSLSFRRRVLVSIAGLIVGTVGLALLFATIVTNREIKSTADQTSLQTSTALRNAIKNTSEQLLVKAALLADRQGTRNLYQIEDDSITDDEKTVCEHLDRLSKTSSTDWIALINSSGKVIGASEGSPLQTHDDAIQLQIVKSALNSKPNGDLYLNSGKAAVLVADPIVIGEYVQAVFVLGKKVDRRYLEEITAASNSEVILSEGTNVVASTVDLPKNSAAHGAGEYFIKGENFFGSTRPIQVYKFDSVSKLNMIALVSESSITSKFAPLKNALWLLLVLGSVFGYCTGKWLSGSLVSPIEQLVSSFRILQSGRLPEPYNSNRLDEIGVLQTAFDEMSDSIVTSRSRLIKMLDIDPLTELLNYRSFRKEVETVLQESSVENVWIGLMDIDYFEQFNQKNGAEAGDRLLVNVAKIVSEETEEGTVIARFGGNEFAFLAGEESEYLAEKIRRRVEEELETTVSVGLCRLSEDTNRVDTALLALELAVSQSKNAGRNRVRVFDGFAQLDNEANLSFLQQSSYAAVKALAEAVDAKDEYTRGHSTRVAQYAKSLAEACQYDSGFVDLVFVTGTLHDVGKIGVPDSALKKPGKLSDEEFEMIKLHPALGEKIVRQIPALADTLPGIRSHHERWDGKGYPDMLKGEEISLLARILAIADTYDAMTSDRPYRKGLDVSVAVEAIRAGAGSQFDPALAEAFIDMMQAKTDKAA